MSHHHQQHHSESHAERGSHHVEGQESRHRLSHESVHIAHGHGHGHGRVREREHGKRAEHEHLDIPPAPYGVRDGHGVHGRLDAKKSVEELVKAGVFRHAREGHEKHEKRDVSEHPVAKVEVRYQDRSGKSGGEKQEPDFRVRKDGTVEVLHNPDFSKSKHVVVEVERAPNEKSAPAGKQQEAIDSLVGYLSERFMKKSATADGGVKHEGEIADEQGLVSDRVKRKLHVEPSAEDRLTPEAREQVRSVNRWHGSGGGAYGGGDGGRFSAREGGEAFAGRDVPRQPDEDDKVAAIKDVCSGYFSKGEKHPYTVARHDEERGWRVGRYGFDGGQYHNWLMGLSIEQIEKLVKEGKLPQGALDMREGKNTPEAAKMKEFLEGLRKGHEQPSAGEVGRFVPKAAQELMANDLVKGFAGATAERGAGGAAVRVDIGRVALSMELGHVATQAECGKPENRALMRSAEDAYGLALRRQMDGDVAVDLSDAARKIVACAKADVGQKLWTKHARDTQYGNLGCAASVSSVLRDARVANVDEIGVRALASTLKERGFTAHGFGDRQPGDVIIALGRKHGHTGVVGETRDVTYDNNSRSGCWSRDPAGYWLCGKWPVVYVLRAPKA